MFDFIKSIIESTRQTSSERLKSPFIGSFFFSWFGFNWDAVAIMLFSPKNIEARILIVKTTHDITEFIIGPLFLSTLICLLLPWINKGFIWYQTKPIDQATSLSMISRIKRARKQLTISRIQAKKELANKREEKEIESNISSIIKDNASMSKLIEELEKDLTSTKESFSTLTIENEVLKNSQSSNMNEIDRYKSEIQELKKDNAKINETYHKSQLSLIDSQNNVIKTSKEKEDLNKILTSKTNYSDHMHKQLSLLSECFPNIFFGVDGNGNVQTTYEAVKKMVKINDGQWDYKFSQPNTQLRMREDLSKLKDLLLETKIADKQKD